MIDFTLVLIWRLPHSRFDMIDDPLFDMTSDSPFDMIWLSLRNEGFLTLLLTIEKTVISLSFRSYNLNTHTHHFQRENTFGKECSFFANERPFPKWKHDAKKLSKLYHLETTSVFQRKVLLSLFRRDYPPLERLRSIENCSAIRFVGL